MKPGIPSTFIEDWKIHKILRTKSLGEWFQGIVPGLFKPKAAKMGLLLEHFEFMEKFTLDDFWVSYLVISPDDDSPNPLRHTRSPSKVGGQEKRFTSKVWLMLFPVISWLYVYNLLSLPSPLSLPSQTWSSTPRSLEAIGNKMSKCNITDLSRSRGSSRQHCTRWQRAMQMWELYPLWSPGVSKDTTQCPMGPWTTAFKSREDI